MSVVAPPIATHVTISSERPGDIVQLVPTAVTCAGAVVSLVRLERPFTSSTRRYSAESSGPPAEYVLDFAIDDTGRAIDIHARPTLYPGFLVDTGDLSPSLAASRFPAGAPRTNCQISFGAKLTPVTTAPASLLYETASAPFAGAAQDQVYARIGEVGDCRQGPGSPRQINYPDFESITQAPGTRSWSFLRFDVDVNGRTRDVRVVGSSGNAALDMASIQALRANRYARGKVSHGCIFHFYRLGNTPVEAPAIPSDAPRDNGELSACTIDPKSMQTLMEGNAYPTAFSARRIEGYAIIGFDTAPWGGIGNARVIASEPDASFGLAAVQAIANAKVAESDAGHRNCVRRIVFRLPKEKPAN